MSSRSAVVIVVVGIIAIAVAEVALLCRETTPAPTYAESDGTVAVAPERPRKRDMIDRLDFLDSADAFAAGQFDQVALDRDAPARLELNDQRDRSFPRQGEWLSPQTKTEFPFVELVPSWNACTPGEQTGVTFCVRTRDAATAEWTPWLRIGSWGRTTGEFDREECDAGAIDVDTLKLKRPADAYQIRAILQNFDLKPGAVTANPSIRRITVSYAGWPESRIVRAIEPAPAGWARSLDVPYIPQGDNADAITGMTCSPTSVSMVLHYWGVNNPAMENCLAIWDEHHALFGNWSNATQRASELGMDAWLQRFSNWEQVKAMIARGQPVIASIRFERGTFPSNAIMQATAGHLLVIRGFKEDGSVIVNDPASRAKGNGIVYAAADLAHAWFDHGGVGYVIHPPPKPLPASLVKNSAQARGGSGNDRAGGNTIDSPTGRICPDCHGVGLACAGTRQFDSPRESEIRIFFRLMRR